MKLQTRLSDAVGTVVMVLAALLMIGFIAYLLSD
jgi:hypothetical protein